MWMNTDRYCFSFSTFEIDIVINEVFSEYIAFSQEFEVSCQEHQCFFQGSWHTADFFFICIRQFIDVLIQWTIPKLSWD